MEKLNARQLTYERTGEEVSWRPVAAAIKTGRRQLEWGPESQAKSRRQLATPP